MIYYVNIKHPITGATIQGVPTGQKETSPIGTAIEVMVITPKSNLTKIWVQRGELLEEQHSVTN